MRKKRILLCDDELVICESLKMFLSNRLKTVDCAYDGEQGLKMALENDYDVIITDYSMPKMDGLSFLRELRNQGDYTTAILFSGHLDFISEDVEKELAISHVVEKPIDDIAELDQLLDIITFQPKASDIIRHLQTGDPIRRLA
tara:strand:- start:220 stop:648 length:429 start_codon:yes stop_codon:yes gene_type:complete